MGNSGEINLLEILSGRVEYDANTGRLIWLNSPDMSNVWNGAWAGKEAGRINNQGYRQIGITINGKTSLIQAHRLVWFIVFGEPPKGHIDHVNHIRDDNRITNLRDVDLTINNKNKSKQANNTSGYTGVYWVEASKKWRATIQVSRKQIHLGLFVELGEAVSARKQAEKLYNYHENHGAER